jgi:serine/threonine-protein kinase
MSGPPVSGGPVSPGAGGTRIMPGGAVPPLAGVGSPGMPGHQARGAAGVPPPPPSGDTATYIGGTGGYQPPPPSPRPSGGGRNNLVLVGIAAVVLLVLIGVGGIYLATRGNETPSNAGDGGGPTPAATSAAPTQSAKPTGKTVTVNCDRMKGRQLFPERNTLERQKLKVKVVPQDSNTLIPNQIISADPCGDVAEGTEITLTVTSGKRPGNGGGNSSAPGTEQSGGSDNSPSPGASPSCLPPKMVVDNKCVGV